ncbi:hypothetical protein PIB30_089794, partial [Stylosanthes scabra]|nr:hypothetical protein [Stylosanthes scabra]
GPLGSGENGTKEIHGGIEAAWWSLMVEVNGRTATTRRLKPKAKQRKRVCRRKHVGK